MTPNPVPAVRRTAARRARARRTLRVRHVLAPLVLAMGLSTAAPALAEAPSQCPTSEDLGRLSAFAEELRAEPSTERARARALRKVAQSRRAIERAARIVPDDVALREHQRAIAEFEAGVRDAQSPDEVADRFAALEARADASACQYSTGEVVAIVLGFILGILPGIILLVLLC